MAYAGVLSALVIAAPEAYLSAQSHSESVSEAESIRSDLQLFFYKFAPLFAESSRGRLSVGSTAYRTYSDTALYQQALQELNLLAVRYNVLSKLGIQAYQVLAAKHIAIALAATSLLHYLRPSDVLSPHHPLLMIYWHFASVAVGLYGIYYLATIVSPRLSEETLEDIKSPTVLAAHEIVELIRSYNIALPGLRANIPPTNNEVLFLLQQYLLHQIHLRGAEPSRPSLSPPSAEEPPTRIDTDIDVEPHQCDALLELEDDDDFFQPHVSPSLRRKR